MFGWLKNWSLGYLAIRRVSKAQKQLRDMEGYTRSIMAGCDDRERELTRLGKLLDNQRVEIGIDVVNSGRLLSKMEEALDTARAELRVAEKTVEALVAANRVLTDRWDAEAAVQTRLRAAQSRPEET